MQFRRSGTRDERRRRALIDDDKKIAAEGSSSGEAGKQKAAARAYSPAALEAAETRLSDLIPISGWSIAILFLAALAAVVGVQTLYSQLSAWRTSFPQANLAGLDVTQRDSLQGWLSSMLLATSGLVCVAIYTIRRHKEDDYRGRYRLWLWAAALLMLASIDAIAGLHSLLSDVAIHFSGTPLAGDGSVWWMGSIAFFALVLGVWVTVDIWRSRGSLTLLVTAATGYITCATMSLRPVILDATLAAMTASLVMSLAHLSLLLSLTLYARFVLLDARGLLPAVAPRKPRAPKVRKKKVAAKASDAENGKSAAAKKADAASKSGDTRRTDLDSGKSSRPQETKSSQPAPKTLSISAGISKSGPSNASSDEDDEDGDTPDMQNLSRAERKRLRKMQRRAGRSAA